MNKYEAMFIVKPDLSEEEKKTVFNQMSDPVLKNQGILTASGVWAEKRKLCFPVKKYQEGLYYLLNFSISPIAVKEIKQAYKLNESILRVLVTRIE